MVAVAAVPAPEHKVPASGGIRPLPTARGAARDPHGARRSRQRPPTGSLRHEVTSRTLGRAPLSCWVSRVCSASTSATSAGATGAPAPRPRRRAGPGSPPPRSSVLLGARGRARPAKGPRPPREATRSVVARISRRPREAGAAPRPDCPNREDFRHRSRQDPVRTLSRSAPTTPPSRRPQGRFRARTSRRRPPRDHRGCRARSARRPRATPGRRRPPRRG
jgi:hypothetical protein